MERPRRLFIAGYNSDLSKGPLGGVLGVREERNFHVTFGMALLHSTYFYYIILV